MHCAERGRNTGTAANIKTKQIYTKTSAPLEGFQRDQSCYKVDKEAPHRKVGAKTATNACDAHHVSETLTMSGAAPKHHHDNPPSKSRVNKAGEHFR